MIRATKAPSCWKPTGPPRRQHDADSTERAKREIKGGYSDTVGAHWKNLLDCVRTARNRSATSSSLQGAGGLNMAMLAYLNKKVPSTTSKRRRLSCEILSSIQRCARWAALLCTGTVSHAAATATWSKMSRPTDSRTSSPPSTRRPRVGCSRRPLSA